MPKKMLNTLFAAGGAIRMQDGGSPMDQMFNFNPMAAKAAKQKQMRESTPETPLGALGRGFATGLFGSTEEQVPYTGSIMEGSPERQQSQANLRELGRNIGALTDIGGMVTPFVKPAAQAVTRGATALGKAGLEQVDRAMFGEGPLAALVAPVAPLQAAPRVQAPKAATIPTQEVTYETTTDGPFYRIRPSVSQAPAGQRRGTLESDGTQAGQRPAGGTGSDVPQPITNEAVQQVMVDPANFVRRSADTYTQDVLGKPYELPEVSESSIFKQAPIGRTFMLAATDDPVYKQTVFDQYASQMPEVIQQSGAKNYDELLAASYRQLAKETDEQFKRLPISLSYHRAGEGNYRNSKQMLQDVYGNKHLYVFQGGDEHPYLKDVDPITGLNENEKFRAVHDFFGHAVHGNEFGPKGEEIAWAAHSQMYSPLARLAMSTETRGQNSTVNYTPLNAALKRTINELNMQRYEANRRGKTDLVKEIDGQLKEAWNGFQFAPQKPLLLPPEFISTKYEGEMPDYLRGLIKPEEGTFVNMPMMHFSKQAGLTETDPAFYGTGIKGEEAARLAGTGSVRPRTYFYTDEGVTPEPGLGPHRYRAMGENLYDLAADPLMLNMLARETTRIPMTASSNKGLAQPTEATNALERLIRDYGYAGYINPQSTKPSAVMFGKVPVTPYKQGGPMRRVHISDNPDTMALELAMGGAVRMAGGKAVSDVAEFAGKKFLPKAAAASADISKLGDTTLGQAVKEGRRQRESVTLSGALAPLQAPVRGETSKELLKAQTKQLTDQEKETLDGLRQTYPDFSNAVKFMTPQEVSKIIRNPEGVKEMDRLLQTIPSAKELAAVAKAGTPKQGWYRASTQALIDVFGVQDAPRFASLLAAMSPQTSVESNLINALNTWKNWTSAGRPTDPKQIKAIMGQSVQGSGTEASVLDAWTNNAMRALRAPNPLDVALSGPKVDSFYRNLADDVYRVTNDAWMASGLGVDQGMFSGSPTALQLSRGDPGLSPGYIASSARMREAGQMNKMLPSEAQETTWSYFMPLYEMQRKTGLPAREILQRGLLTPESIRGTPDFSTLLTQGQYGDVLRQAGYGEQLSAMKPYQFPESAPSLSLSEQREVERAARRLESLKGLRESESRSKIFELPKTRTLPSGEVREIMPESGFASAQIEYIPGEGTGILPDMITASPGAKQYFSSRMAGAFRDPQERDILQRSLGLEPLQTRSMTGSFRPSGEIGFQGNVREQAYGVPKARETNPGYASLVEVPLTKRGDIPTEYKDKLGAAEALRGYMTGQQGSTYNLQVPTLKGESAMVKLEKKADPENIRYASAMTDDDVFLADTGRGVAAIFNPYKPGNLPLGERGRRDIADYLGSQDVVPTRNISDYIDYSEALTGPQGTGAATKILQERLSPLDVASQKRLSEAAQPIAGDVLELMTKQHERANIPMRPDYARALELIKRGGIPALMAALAAGEALPAEMVSELLSEAR